VIRALECFRVDQQRVALVRRPVLTPTVSDLSVLNQTGLPNQFLAQCCGLPCPRRKRSLECVPVVRVTRYVAMTMVRTALWRAVGVACQPLTEFTQAWATAVGCSCCEVTSRFNFVMAAVVSLASMLSSTFATPEVSTDLRMTGTM
jgi:hypothetical protein